MWHGNVFVVVRVCAKRGVRSLLHCGHWLAHAAAYVTLVQAGVATVRRKSCMLGKPSFTTRLRVLPNCRASEAEL